MKNKLYIAFVVFIITAKVTKAQTLYQITHPLDEENIAYVDSVGALVVPFGKYYYGPKRITDATIGILWPSKGSGDKWGIWGVNNKGQVLFQVVPDNGPDEVHGGLFRIYGQDNLMGYANMKGDIVIPPRFPYTLPFYDDAMIATFCENCPPNYTKTTGKNIADIKEKLDPNIILKWGAIDRQGNVVIKPVEYAKYQELEKQYLNTHKK